MQSATMIFQSEKDIVMHIAVLVRIAMADGKFLDSEKTFITNTASLYAGTYGTKSFEKMVDENISDLPKSAVDDWLMVIAQQPSEARNLIKDMIVLGHIDGDYCEKERNAVIDMAARLQITQDVVEKIEVSLLNLIMATKTLQSIIETGKEARGNE